MCIALITAGAAASPAGQYKLHGPCGVKTVSTEEDVNTALEQMYKMCGYSADVKTEQNLSLPLKFYVRGSATLPVNRKFDQYSSKFKVGASAALGVEFHPNWSAELESTYLGLRIRHNGLPQDNRKASIWSGFINVLFHPELNKNIPIKPFIGVGVGYSNNKVSSAKDLNGIPVDLLTGATTRKFAYQALIGLEYLLNQSFSLVVDARMQKFGKVFIPDGDVPPGKHRKLSISMLSLGGKAKF